MVRTSPDVLPVIRSGGPAGCVTQYTVCTFAMGLPVGSCVPAYCMKAKKKTSHLGFFQLLDYAWHPVLMTLNYLVAKS